MAVAENLGRAAQVEPVARPQMQVVEDLFTAHSRLVYAYCLRHLRSHEEAEDAVQATYLNACRSLLQGAEPEVAQAWLLKIAHNVCLTRIRSSSRRSRLELAQDPQTVEDRAPAPELGDELFGIADALATLPVRERRAILLREWQGLSYREVAAKLGLTQAAVETLIFRARRALAAALEDPQPVRRRRLLHSLDLGAALAGLKSALAGSLSASVATGVAVAASATAIATSPVAASLEPRVQPPPATDVAVEPTGPLSQPVSFSTRSAQAEHLPLVERSGPPSWAGPKGKKQARVGKANADRGRQAKKLSAGAKGKAAGTAGGPPAWAGQGRSPQGGGPPSGRGGGKP